MLDDYNVTSGDPESTGAPIDAQNLVSGTNKYKISSFTANVLQVIKMEILNSDADATWLKHETIEDFSASFDALYISDVTSGIPTHYTIFGDYIYLRPSPNYNETKGLRIYFNRAAVAVAPTDTTKVPGTPAIHHMYLCRKTALPFLIERKLPQAGAIAQMIQQDERAIINFFSRRNRDADYRLTTKQRIFK